MKRIRRALLLLRQLSRRLAARIGRWRLVQAVRRRFRPRSRLAKLWLPAHDSHPLLVDVGATAGLTGLLVGLFESFGLHPSSVGGHVAVAVATLIGAFLLVRQFTLFLVGDLVRKAYSVGAAVSALVSPDAAVPVLGILNRFMG